LTAFSPTPEDYLRYGRKGVILVQKLNYRYPKNPKQKHDVSIEKLIVDLFAERIVRAIVSTGDYPAALETALNYVKKVSLLDFAYLFDAIKLFESTVMNTRGDSLLD